MASELFREMVEHVFGGVQARAADALGVSPSLVSYICDGKRGVSPQLAAKIEAVTSGKYRKESFIWPEAA